eukprot:2889038-Rhodomonas_salina.1
MPCGGGGFSGGVPGSERRWESGGRPGGAGGAVGVDFGAGGAGGLGHGLGHVQSSSEPSPTNPSSRHQQGAYAGIFGVQEKDHQET